MEIDKKFGNFWKFTKIPFFFFKSGNLQKNSGFFFNFSGFFCKFPEFFCKFTKNSGNLQKKLHFLLIYKKIWKFTKKFQNFCKFLEIYKKIPEIHKKNSRNLQQKNPEIYKIQIFFCKFPEFYVNLQKIPIFFVNFWNY